MIDEDKTFHIINLFMYPTLCLFFIGMALNSTDSMGWWTSVLLSVFLTSDRYVRYKQFKKQLKSRLNN